MVLSVSGSMPSIRSRDCSDKELPRNGTALSGSRICSSSGSQQSKLTDFRYRRKPSVQRDKLSSVVGIGKTPWKVVDTDKKTNPHSIVERGISDQPKKKKGSHYNLPNCNTSTRRYLNELPTVNSVETVLMEKEGQNAQKTGVGHSFGNSSRTNYVFSERMPNVITTEHPTSFPKGKWWRSIIENAHPDLKNTVPDGLDGCSSSKKLDHPSTLQSCPMLSRNVLSGAGGLSPQFPDKNFSRVRLEGINHHTKLSSGRQRFMGGNTPELASLTSSKAVLSTSKEIHTNSLGNGGGRKTRAGGARGIEPLRPSPPPSKKQQKRQPQPMALPSYDLSGVLLTSDVGDKQSSIPRSRGARSPTSLTLSLFSFASLDTSDRIWDDRRDPLAKRGENESSVKGFFPSDVGEGDLMKQYSVLEEDKMHLKPLLSSVDHVKAARVSRSQSFSSHISRISAKTAGNDSLHNYTPKGEEDYESESIESSVTSHTMRKSLQVDLTMMKRGSSKNVPIRALPLSSLTNRVPAFEAVKKRFDPTAFHSIGLSKSNISVWNSRSQVDAAPGVVPERQQQQKADGTLENYLRNKESQNRTSHHHCKNTNSNSNVANTNAAESFKPLVPFGFPFGSSAEWYGCVSWAESVEDKSSCSCRSQSRSSFESFN